MEHKEKLFKSVAIVGGGIGGLTLAHLLHDSGIDVTVYERDIDEHAREQGYYIGLNKTGLPALKQIVDRVKGLNEMLHESSAGTSFIITNAALKELMFVSGLSVDDSTLVSRWGLRATLTQGLNIKFNKRFVRYEEHSDKVEIVFEDGTRAEADLLIGADGAQSLVRKQRCPEVVNENLYIINCAGSIPVDAVKIDDVSRWASKGLLRGLGYNGRSLLTFRFTPAKGPAQFLWALSWPYAKDQDLKAIFGSEPSEDREVYMQAVHKKLIEEAEKSFETPDVATMIRSTPLNELLDPRQMHSSKPINKRPWPKTTRVLLLGDAIHPMTTHAGLGANTALADALELSAALKQQTWQALEKYEVELFVRGSKSVSTSLSSTNMIHVSGFIKQKLRNSMLWVIGSIIAIARKFSRK